jgi:uncharacterized protein (UPF0248 family)
MLPLERLLHRIKWDPEFGKGVLALGYYDRVLDREIVVPFTSVTIDTHRSDTFAFTDQNSVTHRIPLHRVRAVYRDGSEIWRRRGRGA